MSENPLEKFDSQKLYFNIEYKNLVLQKEAHIKSPLLNLLKNLMLNNGTHTFL